MKIDITEHDNTVVLSVEGRLDTTTFSGFKETLSPYLDGVKNMIMDFAELEYLSSAGLRVVLRAQQILEESDRTLILRNCNTVVMEAFEITGLANFMNFE